MKQNISFILNGKPVQVQAEEDRMLLWVLRSDLGLTGTKFGCGEGLCGACTVIADDQAMVRTSIPFRPHSLNTARFNAGFVHRG